MDASKKKDSEFHFPGSGSKAHVEFNFTGPNMDQLCSEINNLKLLQSSPSKPENGSEGDSDSKKGETKASPPRSTEKEDKHREDGDEEDNSSDEDNESNSSYSTAAPIDIEVPDECVEGENLIVEYRAKLLRLDNEKKEWVERGLGKITLLQSLHDHKKCRVVMWREGNGLLACNFRLFSGFQVTYFQNNRKILCWKCFDSCLGADWETFTCRFKTEEESTDFKDKLIQFSTNPPETPLVISLLLENENGDAIAEAVGEETGNDDAVVPPTPEGHEEEEESGNAKDVASPIPGIQKEEESDCAGCRGCDSSGFKFPALSVTEEQEPVINCSLSEDACKDLPAMVPPAMFN